MADNYHAPSRNSQNPTMMCQVLTTFTREQIERITKKLPRLSTQEYHNEILAMIPGLTSKALGKYKLSHKKLQETLEPDELCETLERAFWSFYHDALAMAKDTDPQGRNDEDIHFFYNVVKMWQAQGSSSKMTLRRKATKNTKKHPAPPIPPEIASALLAKETNGAVAEDENLSRGVCGGIDQHRLSSLSLLELEKYLLSETKTLKCIDRKLSDCRGSEHAYWLKQIQFLITQEKCPEVKIGFFGATGTGKSSLINALLSERLLPSSSRQACTPFLTEVKYNEDTDANRRIRMVVHFIDRDSWACEVERFLAAFHTAGSNEETVAKDDVDFKLMRDKIRILCPDLARTSINQMCSDDLIEHKNLVQRLGQSDTSYFSHTKDAYAAIDGLIKGRTGPGGNTDANRLSSVWPLIKFIEVEVRNATLKHGLTIVDLPGVHDSNKARSSIAKQSMKDCSAVYIVAPIIRAADDASAGKLLSTAFEHQFHLDNLSLTFVCTKSDDIGPPDDEAADLGVEDEVASLQSRIDEIYARRKELQDKESILLEQLRSTEAELQIPKSYIATYQHLKKEIKGGQPQLPPVFSYAGNKRKRTNDEDIHNVHLGSSTAEGFVAAQNRQMTTIDDLDRCFGIDDIKADFEIRSKAAAELTAQIASLNNEVRALEDEQNEIKPRMWQVCIAARNDAVKSAVKASVAETLKQFQEQDMAEHINSGAHPTLSENEVDVFAKDMHFMAVSSKAFEYLCQKQRQSNIIDLPPSIKSFTTCEQTGIPSLIDHCVKQAQTKRRSHAVQLLNKIWKARNGLYLSISGRMFRKGVTEEDLTLAKAEIDQKFSTLETALEAEVASLGDRILKSVKNMVMRKFSKACQEASNRAASVTKDFGDSVKSAGTYRAILVRGGFFTSSDTLSYDFNSELLQPVMDVIGPSWKTTFAEKLPAEIGRQQLSCYAPVQTLRDHVLRKATELGCSPKTSNLVKEQYERHMHEIEEASNAYYQSLQFEQRRDRAIMFQVVKEDLLPAYTTSADIKGKGAGVRMKRQMVAEVDARKSIIFDHATKETRRALENSLSTCAKQHTDDLKDILAEMKRTYEDIFKFSEAKTSKADLDFDREILDMLEQDIQEASTGESKTIKEEVEAIWNLEVAEEPRLFVDEEQ